MLDWQCGGAADFLETKHLVVSSATADEDPVCMNQQAEAEPF